MSCYELWPHHKENVRGFLDLISFILCLDRMDKIRNADGTSRGTCLLDLKIFGWITSFTREGRADCKMLLIVDLTPPIVHLVDGILDLVGNLGFLLYHILKDILWWAWRVSTREVDDGKNTGLASGSKPDRRNSALNGGSIDKLVLMPRFWMVHALIL